jgi:hypothetical protein
MNDTTTPPPARSGSSSAPKPPEGTTLYLRTATLEAPRVVTAAAQARRARLIESVARRRLRLDATISLVRSRHLADAAQADPQLQGDLRKLIDFVQAPTRRPKGPDTGNAPDGDLSR